MGIKKENTHFLAVLDRLHPPLSKKHRVFETGLRTAGAYFISLPDDSAGYIGCSENIFSRLSTHMHQSHCVELYNHIKEYGAGTLKVRLYWSKDFPNRGLRDLERIVIRYWKERGCLLWNAS